MITLLTAVCALLLMPVQAERSGFAAHYKPGLFEQVARNRGLHPVACMAAVTSNHQIGAWVTITRVKTGRSERCRITDVCNRATGDCARLRARNIVAELSFGAARRLCGISYYGQEPPSACIVRVH